MEDLKNKRIILIQAELDMIDRDRLDLAYSINHDQSNSLLHYRQVEQFFKMSDKIKILSKELLELHQSLKMGN